MKSLLPAKSIAIVFFLILSLSLSAQTSRRAPRWVSSQGYWVVESNLEHPNYFIVRFYNNRNALVYREELDDIDLDLRKRSVKIRLRKALDKAIEAWIKNEEASLATNLVARCLRRQ